MLLETPLDDTPTAVSEADDRYFVFGNYIDEVLLMTVSLSSTAADYYYGHDHLYSPTVLFDDTGTIVERYEYNAYGKCTVLNPDFTADTDNISDLQSPYLFTGRRLDILDTNGSFKIQYSRARYYDPKTGRFLQRDPYGINPAGGDNNRFDAIGQYSDGINLYQYVNSGSANVIDPWGLYGGKKECPDCREKSPVCFIAVKYRVRKQLL